MSKPVAYFYRDPINIRLSPEKLADFVRWSQNRLDSGDMYIFFNTKRNHCKIIWDDRGSINVLEKRLERGTFAPDSEIKLTQDTIEDCLYGGISGQQKLLQSLMGNVIYLDKARK